MIFYSRLKNHKGEFTMTRFSILAVFILIFRFVFSDSACSEMTAGADSIQYLGHAFVKIKTSEEKVIYIDPFGVNAFTDSADIVLITHEHGDHNDLSRIRSTHTQRSGSFFLRKNTFN
jgi:hypothetical protein